MSSSRPPRNLTVKRGVVPGIKYKVANAAQTLTTVVKEAMTTGVLKADKKKIEERLNICFKCENFNGTTCKICGCVMKFKSALQAAKCPLDKWK